MPEIPAYSVAGVRINALTVAGTLDVMDEWIRTGHRDYVVLTGAHGVVEMQSDPDLKQINNDAGLTTPDGMSVVSLGWLKGYRFVQKVAAPDIMDRTFEVSAQRGYKHFLYGGAEGVADELAARIIERFPGVEIVGTYCPPFRPLTEAEVQAVTEQINTSGADIVWVGLGCPKQERWMAQFRPLLQAPVLIGVGAGFDFYTGRIPLAPEWLRHSGFEWLYRMVSEPKRLWPRYSRVVPKFFSSVVKDSFRHRLDGLRGRIGR